MSLAPLDLVSAGTCYRVTFTTYALRLSFFEAIVLDRLIRSGRRQAMILADGGRARKFRRAGGAPRRQRLRGRAGRGDLGRVPSEGLRLLGARDFRQANCDRARVGIPAWAVPSSSRRLHPQVLLGGGSARFKRDAFSSIRSLISSKCHGRNSWVSTPTSMDSALGSSGRRPCECP